jgi:hypothetical protein
MATGAVKTKINGLSRIKVNGKVYQWNAAYRVYNGPHYEQLQWSDLGVVDARPKRKSTKPRLTR